MKYVERVAIVAVVLAAIAVVTLFFHNRKSVNEEFLTEVQMDIDEAAYADAMEKILDFDDEEILKSDTLLPLLTDIYYRRTITSRPNVAMNCYDMELMQKEGKVLFNDFSEKKIVFYTSKEMEYDRAIELPTSAYHIDVSADEMQLAAAMADSTIRIYSLPDGELKATLRGHINRVRDVAFLPGNRLVSASNDQTLAFWDLATGKVFNQHEIHDMNIKRIRLSADNKYVVTSSNDGTACLVYASGDSIGRVRRRVKHGEDYVNDAVLSRDGKLLVTVSGDGVVKFWDIPAGWCRKTIQNPRGWNTAEISSDGKYVLVGGRSGVRLLDTEDGHTIANLPGTTRAIWSMKIFGDNSFMYVDEMGCKYGTIKTGQALIDACRKL